VSLQRKKDKREKDFVPPMEKTSQVKPTTTAAAHGRDSFIGFVRLYARLPLVFSSRYNEVGEQCEKETKTLTSRMMFICENKTSTRLRMVLKCCDVFLFD
jgi:hypothetical protein